MKAVFLEGRTISENNMTRTSNKAQRKRGCTPSTDKMERIQNTKSSFKFRLCAMLALRPITEQRIKEA